MRLPDGLNPLADHNLISRKSLCEPLDDWTLKELSGGTNGHIAPIGVSNTL